MDQEQSLNLSLNKDVIIRRVFWTLFGIELFIVFLDVFVNHYKWTSIGAIRRMVNITREDSLSNWFSSLQLVAAGTLLWLNAIAARIQPQNFHAKRKFYCWSGIAVFFIYMGIDDAIKFHERIGTAFKTILSESVESSGPGILSSIHNAFPSYSWQVVFGPFFVAMGIFILWYLWKELSSQKLKYWFLTGICLYVMAVGMDFVEGLDVNQYKGIAGFFSTKSYRIEHMSKAIEEFLEMLGTTFILIAFLENLFRFSQKWKIDIAK